MNNENFAMGKGIWVIVVILGLLVGVGIFFLTTSGGSPSAQVNPSQAPQVQTNTTQNASPSGELKIEDETVGSGAEAKTGDTVSVNYVGTLQDGTKFDSSYDRNQPFDFTLGSGQVIKGWDQGVVGMKVGGKRKLTIPPDLGYGAQAQGPIPANSTLIFEIELLNIK
jgi:FKBP-type peptidyl-prolyl cis-trans isomerase